MKKKFLTFWILLCGFVATGSDTSAAGPTIVDRDIDAPAMWSKSGSPYLVSKTVSVKAPLTIEPGTIVKFKNTSVTFMIKSDFSAIGTADDKIIFTSVCDSEYGGDTKDYGNRCYTRPLPGDWAGIWMTNTSAKASIEHSVIQYASKGVLYQTVLPDTSYKEVSLRHNEFISNDSAGISVRNTVPIIESNTITGSYYGVEILTSLHERMPKLRNNHIFGNKFGLYDNIYGSKPPIDIDARYNWWGDASGPYYDYPYHIEEWNKGGKGDRVIGRKVKFRPWFADMYQEAPFESDCTENCYSNVLFLPGVEASRLYAKDDPDCMMINCENQLWEPNRNEDVRKLYLDENGKSTEEYDIYTRDVLDEVDVTGQNIYRSFIDRMDALKNSERMINDWQAVPYDWRLSLEDVLAGGTVVDGGVSYGNPSALPRIESELKRLADSSRTGKVTIVAHSNGGLVTKALMRKLGDSEARKLIDTVILVGVPQVGTPAAIGAMLHGYEQDLLGGMILSKSTARGLAEHMPSAYTLLPSREYFSSVETPAVTFDHDKLSDWFGRYDGTINTREGMRYFLADAYKRVDAADGDIQTPNRLGESFLDTAQERHDSIDSWMPPKGIRVVQIAGWGVPGTVSGMHYTTETKQWCEKDTCSLSEEVMRAEPVFTIDGDGTVVTPSALWMGNGERYWVDMKKYNTEHKLKILFGLVSVDHASFFEVPDVDNFIANIVTGNTGSIKEYEYISAEAPSAEGDRLRYTLRAPLELDLYDEEERHTGTDDQGNVEEGIPGTYYRRFGEAKYIFSDTGSKARLSIRGHGKGKGRFTLEIEQLRGGRSMGKVVFKDMPATGEVKATLAIDGSIIDGLGNLMVDEDGDGKDDYIAHPHDGKIVTLGEQIVPMDTAMPPFVQIIPAQEAVATSGALSQKESFAQEKHTTKGSGKDKKHRKKSKKTIVAKTSSSQPKPSFSMVQESDTNDPMADSSRTGEVAGDSTDQGDVVESVYQKSSSLDNEDWESSRRINTWSIVRELYQLFVKIAIDYFKGITRSLFVESIFVKL